MCFECSARRTTLPAAPQACMDVIAHTGVRHIRIRSMHAQHGAIVFHVKPGVGCAHQPHQRVSATPTRYAPYSRSLSHRVPLRDAGGVRCSGRIRSTQCFDETGRTAATRRRESGRLQTSRTRIGSRRQHGAMPPARSTQGHGEFTLPPTTHYRYCVPLFHVKPTVGCSLTRLCTNVRQLHDGRGARCRAETVATYRGASRLNLTANGSHKGKSSPE